MDRREWLLFAGVSALSGSAYLFMKVATDELSPLVVAFARCA